MTEPYLSKKALAVLEVIEELSGAGFCSGISQQELADSAGMSKRHFIRAMKELEEKFHLTVIHRRRAGNIYIPRNGGISDKKSHLLGGISDKKSHLLGGISDKKSHLLGGISDKKSHLSLGISDIAHHALKACMHAEEIEEILHWIGEATRKELVGLEHVTLDYAQQVTDFYEQGVFPDHWDNPVGVLIRIMRRNEKLPSFQMQLPDQADEFTSRGKGRGEIQAERGDLGTLGPDGIWR
jgi:hypothetical protein